MNPFKYTTTVSFELSNLCSYAWYHKKCPLSLQYSSPFLLKDGQKVLSARIVRRVLRALGKYKYGGEINFHGYSEPLEDPRHISFVKYAREQCPKAFIYDYTNGRFFNKTVADELAEAGSNCLIVGLYGSPEEMEIQEARILEVESPLQIKIKRMFLDDRLECYTRGEVNSEKPCDAPLGDVSITKDGEVRLCCYDWASKFTFGSLYEQTLPEILLSKEAQTTFKRLQRGQRFLDVCKRCQVTRIGTVR